jgi:hypothetical protein
LSRLVLPVSTTPVTAVKIYLGIVLLSFYASSATANGDIRGFIPKDENALLTSSGHQEHRVLDHVDLHTDTDASYGFYPGGRKASVQQTNPAEYGEQRKLVDACEVWDNGLIPDGKNAYDAELEVVDDFTLISEQDLVSFKFTTTSDTVDAMS